MNRALLPSVKVATATAVAGAVSAWANGVDWQALIVAVVTLLVSYMVPEHNPAPSSVARAQ